MLKLYENIKKFRTDRGLSQMDLAQMTGYKEASSISKIEAGLYDLPQSKIVVFAKALGVLPGDLMGWNEDVTTLSWDEKALLKNYRSLNKNSRTLIRDLAADFKQLRRHVEDPTNPG